MSRRLTRLALSACALLALGCNTPTRACDLPSDEIAMRALITDSGESTQIYIVLEDVASSTQLALCPDRESLTVNGEPTELVRALGQLFYTVTFETSVPDYEIALTRDDPELEDALASLEMPPEFEVLTPAPDSTHPRSDALEISWAPVWNEHELELAVEDEIASTCLSGLGVELQVTDSGTYTLPAGALVSGTPSGTEVCEVWISLTREAEGLYPSQLHPSGSILAQVKRRHLFSSSQ